MEYLQLNPLKHMDMLVPIGRGTAKLLYAADDGVFLKETKSGAYMMSVSSRELGRDLLDLIPCNEISGGLISFHQSFMLDDIKAKFSHSACPPTMLTNFQAVYFKCQPLPIYRNTEIKPLSPKHFSILAQNYDIDIGADYLQARLAEGALFGGYANGNLIGFIGIHAEGSIGLLKAFSEHRKKGYGAALTSFAANHQLKQGVTPFAQIEINNAPSLALMQKLGFKISNEPVYWLWT
jgi:GNAT superfamily N-acetyltransferase